MESDQGPEGEAALCDRNEDGAPFGIAGITAQGIGAALSPTVAGFVVVSVEYSAAFLTLAGVAAAGLLLF
jgi:hypothetical protein